MSKYLFALLLPLALIACKNNEAEAVVEEAIETTESTVDVNAMPEADASMVSINETMTAITNAGGLTSMSPDAAVAAIDGWTSKLQGQAGAENIVANLNALKTELTAGSINGAAVGEILVKLGTETASVAPDNMALQGLATTLQQAGASLSGK